MKKVRCVLSVLLILISLTLLFSCENNVYIEDYFAYFNFVKNGELTASAQIKNGVKASSLKVPEIIVIDGEALTVTEFKGYETTATDALNAKTIYIPDTVSKFSANWFDGMFNLEKVSVFQTENNLKKDTWPDIQACSIEGKPGYDFKGWFSDQSHTHITSTTDLLSAYPDAYPVWEAKKYNVSFDPNGGSFTTGTDLSSPRTVSQTYDSKYVFPEDPVQKGYYFVGWYTQQTGGQKVTDSTTVKVLDDSTVLYAHWEEKVFKLTLYLNGGVLDNSISSAHSNWTKYQGDVETVLPKNTYTTSTSDIQIYLESDPSLTYKHFAGWYTTSTFTSGTELTSIPETQSGDLTLYAKWENHHYVYEGEVDINEQFLTGVHKCSCGKQHTAEKDKWTQHASQDKTHAVADCEFEGCDVSLDEVFKGIVVVDGFTVIYNIPNTEAPSGDVSVSSPTNGKFYLTFTPSTTPTNIDLFIGFVYKDGSYTKLNQPDSEKYVLEFVPSTIGKYLYIISIGTKSGNTITREGYINVDNID